MPVIPSKLRGLFSTGLSSKKSTPALLVVGAIIVGLACAFRGFDSPVRNPMLYGAPNVYDAGYKLSRMGLARACAFFSFIEHFLGSAIMGIVSLVMLGGYKRMWPLFRQFNWKDWLSLLYVSVGGSALGLYFFLLAMTLGKPVVAILFQQLQPLITIGAAALFLRERPTLWFFIPTVIAVLGVLLIAVPDFIDAAKGGGWIKPASGGSAVLSDVFSLISAVLWGASTVFGRSLTQKVRFWDLVFLRYFGGFLFLVVFAACNLTFKDEYFHYLFHGHARVFGYLDAATQKGMRAYWNWHTTGCVFFGTLITGGVIPLTMYYFGLRLGPAAVAGLCELTFPAVAIFVNWYWLNYALTGYQIGGAVCVMVSVLIVTLLSMANKATKGNDEIPLTENCEQGAADGTSTFTTPDGEEGSVTVVTVDGQRNNSDTSETPSGPAPTPNLSSSTTSM
eukprot:m51a1_g1277 hypothetical protein (449) ;mRNA; f:111177-113052